MEEEEEEGGAVGRCRKRVLRSIWDAQTRKAAEEEEEEEESGLDAQNTSNSLSGYLSSGLENPRPLDKSTTVHNCASQTFSDLLGTSYLSSGVPFGRPPDKYPPCLEPLGASRSLLGASYLSSALPFGRPPDKHLHCLWPACLKRSISN